MQLDSLKIRQLQPGERLQRGDLTNRGGQFQMIELFETPLYLRKVPFERYGNNRKVLESEKATYFRIEYPGKKLRRKRNRGFIKPPPRDEQPRRIDIHL